jgi:hypothetical protein
MHRNYLPTSRRDVYPLLEYYIELDSIEEDDEEADEKNIQILDTKNNEIIIHDNLNKMIYNQWLKGIGLGICIGFSIGYFFGKLK